MYLQGLLLLLLGAMVFALIYQIDTIHALQPHPASYASPPSEPKLMDADTIDPYRSIQTVAELYRNKQIADEQQLQHLLYQHKPYLKRDYTLKRQQQEGMGLVSWPHQDICRVWIEPFIDWDNLDPEADQIPLVSYPEAWSQQPFLRYRMNHPQWTDALRRAFHQRIYDLSTLIGLPVEVRSYETPVSDSPDKWQSFGSITQLDRGYTLWPYDAAAFRHVFLS